MNIIILLDKLEIYNNIPKPLLFIKNKELIFNILDNLNLSIDDRIFILYNKELDNYNLYSTFLMEYPNINLIKIITNSNNICMTLNYGLKEIIKKYKYFNKTIILNINTFYKYDIISSFRSNDIYNIIFYTNNYNYNDNFIYIDIDDNKELLNITNEKINDNITTGCYCFQKFNELLFYTEYLLNKEKNNDIIDIVQLMNIMIKKKIYFITEFIKIKDIKNLYDMNDIIKFENDIKII
jgi:NDP-sugar pyrophosphorylase family protein